MRLTINDYNLLSNDIKECNFKVRALLIDEERRVLVANYGGVFLFPGGGIDKNETMKDAIVRELKEETGTLYREEDLTFLTELNFFQKNYTNRNGSILNRLVKTYYFTGTYKSVDLQVQHLTEKEKRDGFKLELIPLRRLKELILENQNDNPRNIYFQREMLEIIDLYVHQMFQKRLL